MKIINVCMDFWEVGGAERFWQRLSKNMIQYKWLFTKSVDVSADIVIYSNSHKFYEQAKKLNKPIMQRVTGPRSYSLQQPNDLEAVICSSKKGYDISIHKNKYLIYNGIDFEHLNSIKPISCDLLYGCARIGIGQKVDVACEYAIKTKHHLTITGARQHVAENIYDKMKEKYPNFHWTGLLDEDIMLAYVKGCNKGIMPTSVHGVSNFILELVACDKPIINIGSVEVPLKEKIDINIVSRKYDNIIKSILKI